jgi:hypothetical protein
MIINLGQKDHSIPNIAMLAQMETNKIFLAQTGCKGVLLNRVGPVNWVRRRRCEGSSRLETRLNLEDI